MTDKHPTSTDAYNREAETLIARYESQPFEAIHGDILDLLPGTPGQVLDIGAGSGRDAAWFASRGHQVMAVEPATRLRKLGALAHPDPGIVWLDDSLPTLEKVVQTGQRFDLIWLSAVWMHLAPEQREAAFCQLVTLLRPKGRIMLSLRQGPAPEGRSMFPTSAEEIEALARPQRLESLRVSHSDDRLGRNEVRWQSVMLQSPN